MFDILLLLFSYNLRIPLSLPIFFPIFRSVSGHSFKHFESCSCAERRVLCVHHNVWLTRAQIIRFYALATDIRARDKSKNARLAALSSWIGWFSILDSGVWIVNSRLWSLGLQIHGITGNDVLCMCCTHAQPGHHQIRTHPNA